MSGTRLKYCGTLLMLLISATLATGAWVDDDGFSVLYRFQAPNPNTGASPLGSQPDSRPVLGSDHALYGMTFDGGINGTGVIYRFDLRSGQYRVLHAFTALDSNGDNSDGAYPGVALTRGPGDVFYGMATSGGQNGNGTIFKITTWGDFTVLHTFSALDANAHNEDGAYPLRTIVIGDNGNLYGTTRIGGENTCAEVPFPNACGVAWMIDGWGHFHVLHEFTPAEGHAASLLQAGDGLFYGCAVWPNTSLPNGQPLPSGILYRMGGWGDHFEVLYTFSQTNSSGENTDGAECYEPLVETKPGVFYGTTRLGGVNGNGVVFGYSLSNPDAVEVLHEFSATTNGENLDGANPYARLTLGDDGTMYSTASNGGQNGNGVVYRIRPDGDFRVLHTFSATNPTTGANRDGAVPDFGVLVDDCDRSLIGAAALGGRGSSAGLGNSGGTLYRLKVGQD
jgi:uncharacterized repeat protein (TIGR03803 family)